MIDRLRSLLDRPLEPGAVRAVVVLASGIFLGLGLLVVLAGAEPSITERSTSGTATHTAAAPPSPDPVDLGGLDRPHRDRLQDPQDRAGTGAAERAATLLRTHSALQHVPYRRGGISIFLVGARNGQAVLSVSATSESAARRGWIAFLDQYQDKGRAYVFHFHSRHGGHG